MKSWVTAGSSIGADLDAGAVDLLFAVGLPELIDPAQAVIGGEDGGGQGLQQGFELDAGFGRQGDLQDRIAGAEDVGQHGGGPGAGQGQPIAALRAGELLRLFEGDGDAGPGRDQEAGFGQETGEQHAVPVFVGTFLHQAVDALGAGCGIAAVAQLAAMGAQAAAQVALRLCHVAVGLGKVDGEGLQRLAGAFLGGGAGTADGAVQLAAQVSGEGGHGAMGGRR